jgi:hypothetical protein
METEAAVGVSQTYAPDDYVVTLHPDDKARYTGLEDVLEQELSHYLVEAAHERGLVLQGRPRVHIETDAAAKQGEPRVQARFSDPTDQTTLLPEEGILTVHLRMSDSSLVDVPQLPWRIGRALDNDTILEDRLVSRYHATLRLMRGRLCVEDLSSTHGTRLNGERVTVAFLEPGDRLSLGGVDMHIASIERGGSSASDSPENLERGGR